MIWMVGISETKFNSRWNWNQIMNGVAMICLGYSFGLVCTFLCKLVQSHCQCGPPEDVKILRKYRNGVGWYELLPSRYGWLSNRRCWPSAWTSLFLLSLLRAAKKERGRNVIWRTLGGSYTGVSWQSTIGIKWVAGCIEAHSSSRYHKRLCIQ